MMESVFREKECPSDILNGGVPQIHIMRAFLQKDHVQNPVIYQSYKNTYYSIHKYKNVH
jgi:hypothetical protein